MRVLDQLNHLTLLADRVQWMLNQSEMDLSYFLSILDEAGVHPAWACQGIDLDNAGEQLVLSTMEMETILSQTIPDGTFPATLPTARPPSPDEEVLIDVVSDTGIEEWVGELKMWAGLDRPSGIGPTIFDQQGTKRYTYRDRRIQESAHLITHQKQPPPSNVVESKPNAAVQWLTSMPFALAIGVVMAIKIWLAVAILAIPLCFFGSAVWEGVMCVAASLLLAHYLTMSVVVTAPSCKAQVGVIFVLGIWAVIGWSAWTGWPFTLRILSTGSGEYSLWNIAIAAAGCLAAPVSLYRVVGVVERNQRQEQLREEVHDKHRDLLGNI
jgi:hypothetical protein